MTTFLEQIFPKINLSSHVSPKRFLLRKGKINIKIYICL